MTDGTGGKLLLTEPGITTIEVAQQHGRKTGFVRRRGELGCEELLRSFKETRERKVIQGRVRSTTSTINWKYGGIGNPEVKIVHRYPCGNKG